MSIENRRNFLKGLIGVGAVALGIEAIKKSKEHDLFGKVTASRETLDRMKAMGNLDNDEGEVSAKSNMAPDQK